ncbi:hypothetical protein RCL_jg5164.t1 [Rhizophagus clarus]|uniref:Uncharacterized protein n=1 Tax=Rhizophagus clarus TaxID=94130 RepID=A0A8H3LY43_9GLOM|nr:hypothetical protein RCL_jg5164.t1 [Rhizophagus clarus]
MRGNEREKEFNGYKSDIRDLIEALSEQSKVSKTTGDCSDVDNDDVDDASNEDVEKDTQRKSESKRRRQ